MKPTRRFRSRPRGEWIIVEDETGSFYFKIDGKESDVEFVPKIAPGETAIPASNSPMLETRSTRPPFAPLPRSVVAQIHEIENPALTWEREPPQRPARSEAGLLPLFDRGTKQMVMPGSLGAWPSHHSGM
jgi:hypothetical protein